MPDDRDTQTAAPSTDGDDTSTQATATALQDPPESGEAGGEAPKAAAANGSEPKAKAEAETKAKATDAGATDAPAEEEGKAEATPEGSAADADADRRSPAPDSEILEDQIQADADSDETAVSDETAAKAESESEAAAKSEAESEKTEDATETTEAQAAKGEDTAEKAEAKTEKVEAQAEKTGEEEADPKAETKAETKGDKADKKDQKDQKDQKGSAKAEAGDENAEEKGEKKEPELDDPALKELRKAKEEGTTVTGKVIGWNRGGFHVVINEITAFCPASEMELGRPRSPETYMDREMDFKVAKFQRRGRRVVLSRSDLLKNKREELLAALKPGAVTEGVVTSLPDFGAFVDLGGVEGLVHVSELSRSRVKHPRDMLKSGQKVEVKVLKVEKGGDRISLSMKELEPDPWKGVAERYPRGSKFEGKILRHADFGMFVELEPDVEGLVHVSQLAPGVNMNADELKPGNTLEGWIREVDTKRGRISLSMREVPEDDPWKNATTTLPEGEMVEGTVESIAPFGVFINLAPGLTGLLPNSHTGLPRGTNPNRAFNPGSTVSVQVLAVDPKRKRISLGREGSRVEATKADLQEFKKQQKQTEPSAPSAMEAAFAALGFGDGDEEN